MQWLTMAKWSPYVVGIGIGILSWLTFLLSDRTIGCSTPFARFSGMIERLFRGDQVLKRPYFIKFVPAIGWDSMLVLGILIGAFLSALLFGQFQLQWVSDLWQQTFGNTPLLRLVVTRRISGPATPLSRAAAPPRRRIGSSEARTIRGCPHSDSPTSKRSIRAVPMPCGVAPWRSRTASFSCSSGPRAAGRAPCSA